MANAQLLNTINRIHLVKGMIINILFTIYHTTDRPKSFPVKVCNMLEK